MELPKRKPNRISGYNYSTSGAYFLTLCIEDQHCILCKITENGICDAPVVQLTEAGTIARKYLLSGDRIPGITVDKFVIMPNHIHMILLVDESACSGTSRAPSPTNAVIPHFISTFKRFCHRDLGKSVFQRSYHDHVIRNDRDYLRIWQYIDTNPAKWKEDCFFVAE